MNTQEMIRKYFQDRREEMAETLKELVRIPSVRSAPAPGAPFGENCAEILRAAKSLYEKNGFETELDEEGGYLLAFFGEGKKSLGLFAHGDVVPAADDWQVTPAFEPLDKDGFIFGRGAEDDKAAIVISLYCAMALRDLGLPFSSRLVMFTGANEETGMADVRNYAKKHTPPDFSLVCDSAFPLFRGDKGTLRFWANQNEPMENLSDFSGGTAFNIILSEVTARIGDRVFTEKGLSKHGALPEGSVNAAYLMAKKLSDSPLLTLRDRERMKFISELLENYYGEVFGIENTDSDFGRLTVTNGIVKSENGKISLSFDMRYGRSVDIAETKQKIASFFSARGWSVSIDSNKHPFCIPSDDPYLLTCLETYKLSTGDLGARPHINAGGTYARYLPRAAEIGVSLDGGTPPVELPEGHGGVHQPDEFISVSGMLKAAELTCLMLLKCDETETSK